MRHVDQLQSSIKGVYGASGDTHANTESILDGTKKTWLLLSVLTACECVPRGSELSAGEQRWRRQMTRDASRGRLTDVENCEDLHDGGGWVMLVVCE